MKQTNKPTYKELEQERNKKYWFRLGFICFILLFILLIFLSENKINKLESQNEQLQKQLNGTTYEIICENDIGKAYLTFVENHYTSNMFYEYIMKDIFGKQNCRISNKTEGKSYPCDFVGAIKPEDTRVCENKLIKKCPEISEIRKYSFNNAIFIYPSNENLYCEVIE